VWTGANAINDLGQVTGSSATSGYLSERVFLWQNGVMSGIGNSSTGRGDGKAINETGRIVGTASANTLRAFTAYDGKIELLNELDGRTFGTGVNNVGTIVGTTERFDPFRKRAFSYVGGTMTDIGSLGGRNSEANAINNDGVIVGSADTADQQGKHAFLYQNGVMSDLGTLGGKSSTAFAINDAGMIIGDSNTASSGSNNRVAFMYRDGVMLSLGTLGGETSSARGLNDAGSIVGESAINWWGLNYAFLYESGTMHNLNDLFADPSWRLERANDINNLGQIVGYGSHNGVRSAFLLDPILAVDVPEPSSAILFGLAALVLYGSRRRRRSSRE
jgi:probable HAF family extracellular repeat protein